MQITSYLYYFYQSPKVGQRSRIYIVFWNVCNGLPTRNTEYVGKTIFNILNGFGELSFIMFLAYFFIFIVYRIRLKGQP